MPRSVGPWLVTAVLFTIGNLGFAVYAGVMGESMHSGAHVALMLVGAYFTHRLLPSTVRQEQPSVPLADGRLDYLQQSVDAVALEVERIGEAQRFAARKQAERNEPAR